MNLDRFILEVPAELQGLCPGRGKGGQRIKLRGCAVTGASSFASISEGQAHIIPHRSAVHRLGNAAVDVAKALIKGNELFFAGKNQSVASFLARFFNESTHQC